MIDVLAAHVGALAVRVLDEAWETVAERDVARCVLVYQGVLEDSVERADPALAVDEGRVAADRLPGRHPDHRYAVSRVSLTRAWRTTCFVWSCFSQAGNAFNWFGHGLILPFEILYLHRFPGLSATAGLATV